MNEDTALCGRTKTERPFSSNTPDGSTERNIYYAPRPFHFLHGDNLRTRETPPHELARQTRTADSFITESAIRSALLSLVISPSNAHSHLESKQVPPDAQQRTELRKLLKNLSSFG